MRYFLAVPSLLAFLLAAPLAPAIASGPVLLSGTANQSFPVGKTLLVPISGTSSGKLFHYTVTSNNKNIMVRAKTGNPYMKLSISYPGTSGTSVPNSAPFAGDMVFQLFRDLAPVTSGYIGGFAQGGFYNNLTFHRIIPGALIQGGDPNGDGSGGPGFTYDNEYNASLIFSATAGQLAMANSGYQISNYLSVTGTYVPTYGSNGSQFFVTMQPSRPFDFNYTIFGQLVEGFDVLDEIANVPTDNERPYADVTITNAEIIPEPADTVLILSASGAGNANITVLLQDEFGATTETFLVSAVADTVNDPPFLLPTSDLTAPLGLNYNISFPAVDLEQDRLEYLDFYNENYLGAGEVTYYAGASRGQSIANFGVEQYNATARGNLTPPGNDPSNSLSDWILQLTALFDIHAISIGLGDKPITMQQTVVTGTAGVPLGAVPVATFNYASVSGGLNSTGQINWGDGTPLDYSPVIANSGGPGATAFEVTSTTNHVYARPGIYPLVVKVTSQFGGDARSYGTAIISDTTSTLSAAGTKLQVTGGAAASRLVATFTDSAPARPSAYSAVVDWGDGVRTTGTVQSSGRAFNVFGSHAFLDAEQYPVEVVITKGTTSATAWSMATVTGVKTPQHLPPFPLANLEIIPNINLVTSGTGPTLQGKIEGSLQIVNFGNKTSSKIGVTFYVSTDTTTANIIASFPSSTLSLGPLRTFDEYLYNFTDTPSKADKANHFTDVPSLKLPVGTNGSKDYLLIQLNYTDPITDYLDVNRLFAVPL